MTEQQKSFLDDPFYQHLMAGGDIEAWFNAHPEEDLDIVVDATVSTDSMTHEGFRRSKAWTPEGWSYKKALELGIFERVLNDEGQCIAVRWVGEDHLQEES